MCQGASLNDVHVCAWRLNKILRADKHPGILRSCRYVLLSASTLAAVYCAAGVSLGEAGRGRVDDGGHSGAHSSALRGQQPAWTAVCGLQG